MKISKWKNGILSLVLTVLLGVGCYFAYGAAGFFLEDYTGQVYTGEKRQPASNALTHASGDTFQFYPWDQLGTDVFRLETLLEEADYGATRYPDQFEPLASFFSMELMGTDLWTTLMKNGFIDQATKIYYFENIPLSTDAGEYQLDFCLSPFQNTLGEYAVSYFNLSEGPALPAQKRNLLEDLESYRVQYQGISDALSGLFETLPSAYDNPDQVEADLYGLIFSGDLGITLANVFDRPLGIQGLLYSSHEAALFSDSGSFSSTESLPADYQEFENPDPSPAPESYQSFIEETPVSADILASVSDIWASFPDALTNPYYCLCNDFSKTFFEIPLSYPYRLRSQLGLLLIFLSTDASPVTLSREKESFISFSTSQPLTLTLFFDETTGYFHGFSMEEH
jgi:hypothetical protein